MEILMYFQAHNLLIDRVSDIIQKFFLQIRNTSLFFIHHFDRSVTKWLFLQWKTQNIRLFVENDSSAVVTKNLWS